MYDGNGANATHLLEPFNEFPSCSQLPIHPSTQGWAVPECRSYHWGSVEPGGSVNHFANRRQYFRGSRRGHTLEMLSGGCGMLEALPAPASCLPV